jgi:hypothetical protein
MPFCFYCKQFEHQHVNLKCLFSPTEFRPRRCHYCSALLLSEERYMRGPIIEPWFIDKHNGTYQHYVCPD